jgi:hypothetical protein
MARPEFDNYPLYRVYKDLNPDEKNELKGAYFWSDENTEYDYKKNTEKMLEEVYEGFRFVTDDFFCNQ